MATYDGTMRNLLLLLAACGPMTSTPDAGADAGQDAGAADADIDAGSSDAGECVRPQRIRMMYLYTPSFACGPTQVCDIPRDWTDGGCGAPVVSRYEDAGCAIAGDLDSVVTIDCRVTFMPDGNGCGAAPPGCQRFECRWTPP